MLDGPREWSRSTNRPRTPRVSLSWFTKRHRFVPAVEPTIDTQAGHVTTGRENELGAAVGQQRALPNEYPSRDDPQVTVAKINRSSAITAAVISGVVGLIGVSITAVVTYKLGFEHGSQATASAPSITAQSTSIDAGGNVSSSAPAAAGGAPSAPTRQGIGAPPAVYSDGATTIWTNDYFDLDRSFNEGETSDGNGDIAQDSTSVVGADGTVFALAQTGATEYAKCANVPSSAWQGTLSLSGMQVGRELCVVTNEGRLGYLKITGLPIPGEMNTELSFEYVIWVHHS
jgi:hypothetical protein